MRQDVPLTHYRRGGRGLAAPHTGMAPKRRRPRRRRRRPSRARLRGSLPPPNRPAGTSPLLSPTAGEGTAVLCRVFSPDTGVARTTSMETGSTTRRPALAR